MLGSDNYYPSPQWSVGPPPPLKGAVPSSVGGTRPLSFQSGPTSGYIRFHHVYQGAVYYPVGHGSDLRIRRRGGHPVGTTCLVVVESPETGVRYYKGSTWCSESDVYDREAGRTKSLGRAAGNALTAGVPSEVIDAAMTAYVKRSQS